MRSKAGDALDEVVASGEAVAQAIQGEGPEVDVTRETGAAKREA